MKVMKFGGAVLGSKEGFSAMARILDSFSDNNVLIVISALSKTTSLLKQAAFLSESADIEHATSLLNNVIDDHISLADSLLTEINRKLTVRDELSKIGGIILSYLNGIFVTGDLSARTLDKVLSFGETLAMIICSEFLLNHGINLKPVDSTEIIITDNKFGSAEPLFEQTVSSIQTKLLPLYQTYKAVITQGFVAASTNGDITTMGIESSNLTAAIYTAAFGCDELIIWTDVEGIRSADPKLTDNSSTIPYININLAKKASDCGLKLIYPSMLDYAVKSNFKITFRSAFNPSGEFTEIGCDFNEIPYTIIICNQNQTFYSIPDKNYLAEFPDSKWILDLPDGLKVLSNSSSFKHIRSLTENIEVTEKLSAITVLKNPAIDTSIFKIFNQFAHSSSIKNIIYFSDDTLRILIRDDVAVELVKFLHKHLAKENQ